jgi:alpha-tubulin suppressor-like RCC1 family protein
VRGITTALNVQCWGHNTTGALGTGDLFDRHSPTTINVQNAVAVVMGDRTTCARDRAGTVFCWGANSEGAVGNGTWTNVLSPVVISNIGRNADLDVHQHACVRNDRGTVLYCWGNNYAGKLGNGGTTKVNTPTRVTGY